MTVVDWSGWRYGSVRAADGSTIVALTAYLKERAAPSAGAVSGLDGETSLERTSIASC